MSSTSVHDDWLSLIEISGPFLAVPVLKEVFSTGLEELDGVKRKRLRQAYEEWREAFETDDPQFPELHAAWIDEVLSRGLELDEDGKGDVLKRGGRLSANLHVNLPEHGLTLSPDLAVVDEQQDDKPLMLVHTYPQGVNLDAPLERDGWASTPADRMIQLCRATGCRIGLVTNGERWMFVDAPVGAVTTFASWYARMWGQEPITLQAFVHLLGVRRFFIDESEQLPALLDRSLKYQDEVTEALGEQVRRAVEVLIQSLDKADQDRNRELLRGVAPSALYEAGLTVMMRLVFLLSAEERGLLLLGDERYEANYAVSTLRMQLRTESEEILERRWDAWSRLLAIFRAVFGGIEHETLRLPALGGSLFDPDRFPFLEGRPNGSQWRTDVAKPLPIDNRTVLLLLEAIQQFQGRTLSYRALDVEQIGYVYEGLLERTVKRTDQVTLELDATKNAKAPWVRLAELDSARLDGAAQLAKLLQERSGSSASRVSNDLAKPVDDMLSDRLLTACQGDLPLRDRIKPYAHLLRTDPWGYPLVYPAGAFMVTTGSDRRETGTHYTPKSLTEAIVTETLTPVAYVGPSEGMPRDEWVLKSPENLLDLKICDPAMGSGAFLVQACRWMAERLVEAWSLVEASGKSVSVDGEVMNETSDREPLPRDAEVRALIGRRLIAERCLYGVDLNPLAVELAKLSIWLVTLAKDRPFGFLDHNLRCGDSLLGIHRLDQLTELSMVPGGKGQQRLFGQAIQQAVDNAVDLRQRLREVPIRDIHDVEAMARLHASARHQLQVPELIADAFLGQVLESNGNGRALKLAADSLAEQAERVIAGDSDELGEIVNRAASALSTDLADGKSTRQPFHWPLEFPEVFVPERGGFDAMVGNPPFLGGQKITGVAGTAYRNYLVEWIANGARGSADLVAYFFLRSYTLLRHGGHFGLLAVNTIAEGDTRQVGLERMLSGDAVIHAAYPNEAWPGAAAVVTSRVHLCKGTWSGKRTLSGEAVSTVSAFLSGEDEWSPKPLRANAGKSFIGSYVLGMGFVLTEDQAAALIAHDAKNAEVLFPYLNGEDLNSHPEQKPSRWVINFRDWPLARDADGRWAGSKDTLQLRWLREGRVPADYPARVADDFPEVLAIVKREVKPERDALSGNATAEGRKKRWWHYGRDAKALYHAVGRGHTFARHPDEWRDSDKQLPRVLVCSLVSKHLAFGERPNNEVWAHRLAVFSMTQLGQFAFMNSSINDVWARKNSSSLETRLNYSPSDAFETLPLPESVNSLDQLGLDYNRLRSATTSAFCIGLTDLYNRLHDPLNQVAAIVTLREHRLMIDKEICLAYGWHDIELNHGFHTVPYLPENDRVRFTICEDARLEILRRLSRLNRERWQAEQAEQQRLSAEVVAQRPIKRRRAAEVNTAGTQGGLF